MKQYNPIGVAVAWLAACAVAIALAWLFGFVAPNLNVIIFFAAFLVGGYLIGMTYEKLCGKPGVARILLLVIAIPMFVFISQEVYINTFYRVGQANALAASADDAHNLAMNNPDLHITLNIVVGMVLAALGGAASSVKEPPKEQAPVAGTETGSAPAPATPKDGAPSEDSSAFM